MSQALEGPDLKEELRRFGERWGLTRREQEVLNLIAHGTTRIKDVAGRLSLSPNTINNHVNSIFAKTRSRSKSELLTRVLLELGQELTRQRRTRRCPRLVLLASGNDGDAWASGLQDLGCDVRRVHTMIEAREICQTQPFDFFIFDADLPTVNLEADAALWRQPPLSWVQLIALSSLPRTLRSTFVEVHPKPPLNEPLDQVFVSRLASPFVPGAFSQESSRI